ncbi:MAG: FixH family protein [Alysiella sp.]|uniref:FixH family protein n=1 Tax=Alysiella sp. TaxID=1872483 RepID=UPI0026DB04A2|nr:FixH family protein [Alysiella sp.]MDO4433491.1 FixH family protein [Alysiella sp.]
MKELSVEEQRSQAPWYRQPIFWILMSGPIIVVIATSITLNIASDNISDMVSDDYYKDGKHINLQLERDVVAMQRNIHAQVFFNDENNAAKVFISGDFDPKQTINLLLQHPAKKEYDQIIELKALDVPVSGDKHEFSAVFQSLPSTIHWYVRIADAAGTWRIEEKWLPNQGGAVSLKPKENVLVKAATSAAVHE